MPYLVDELYELFRSDIDDTDSSDPLWTEDEVYGYMDGAQKQFALITDCFPDVVTAAITDADPYVAISERYTKIRSVKLASSGRNLRIYNYSDIESESYEDDYGSNLFSLNWEVITGTPNCIVLDMVADKGRLVGIPTADDTLNMAVYRLPLEDIVDDSGTLEVSNTEHQRALIWWMQYLAYSKQDSDMFNTKLANDAKFKFDTYAEKARLRYQRLRRKPGTVSYGGL